MGKHDWETLHLYAGFLMAVSALVHVMLNAKFVKNAICKKKHIRNRNVCARGRGVDFRTGIFSEKDAP